MFGDTNLHRHVGLSEVHLRHCRRRKAISAVRRYADFEVGRPLLVFHLFRHLLSPHI